MNRSEAKYAAELELQRAAGTIVWWKFEGVKLRLADATFYTPDFNVMLADGTMEMHEIKGYWQDDARVKIKVAASLYPFRFIALTAKRGAWQIEDFSG